MGKKLVAAVTVLLCMAVSLVSAAEPAGAVTSITVTPSTGLVAPQAVTVSGSGFTPGSLVGACQAVPAEPLSLDLCAKAASVVTVSPTGTFSVTVTLVRAWFVQRLGRSVDCADPTEQCIIGAAEVFNISGTVATAPLSFAPPPPPPATKGTVTVPPGPHISLETLPVTASGFRPNTRHVVAQCIPQALDLDACGLNWWKLMTDGAGGFETSIQLSQSVFGPGATAGCLDHPGACVIAVAEDSDFPGTVVMAPLTFREVHRQADGQIIRISDGVSKGDDVYNLTGAGQSRTRVVPRGGKWSYILRIQNDGEIGDGPIVSGQGSSGPFAVTYFDSYLDVSDRVVQERYGYFTGRVLLPGQSMDMAVRFEVSPTAAPGSSIDVLITSRMGLTGFTTDTVRLGVVAGP